LGRPFGVDSVLIVGYVGCVVDGGVHDGYSIYISLDISVREVFGLLYWVLVVDILVDDMADVSDMTDWVDPSGLIQF